MAKTNLKNKKMSTLQFNPRMTSNLDFSFIPNLQNENYRSIYAKSIMESSQK